MLSPTDFAKSTTNNHHFSKYPHSPLFPSSRSVNETTATAVTTVPCDRLKQNHPHHKPKPHFSAKDNLPSKSCSDSLKRHTPTQMLSILRTTTYRSHVISPSTFPFSKTSLWSSQYLLLFIFSAYLIEHWRWCARQSQWIPDQQQ